MTIEELKAALAEDIVTVDFTKANGVARTMVCTLAEKHLSHLPMRTTDSVKKRPANLLVVYDTEAQGFRTINTDTIKRWKR